MRIACMLCLLLQSPPEARAAPDICAKSIEFGGIGNTGFVRFCGSGDDPIRVIRLRRGEDTKSGRRMRYGSQVWVNDARGIAVISRFQEDLDIWGVAASRKNRFSRLGWYGDHGDTLCETTVLGEVLNVANETSFAIAIDEWWNPLSGDPPTDLDPELSASKVTVVQEDCSVFFVGTVPGKDRDGNNLLHISRPVMISPNAEWLAYVGTNYRKQAALTVFHIPSNTRSLFVASAAPDGIDNAGKFFIEFQNASSGTGRRIFSGNEYKAYFRKDGYRMYFHDNSGILSPQDDKRP